MDGDGTAPDASLRAEVSVLTPVLDLERVWIHKEDGSFGIGFLLNFITFGGTGTFECYGLRFADGTRSVSARDALRPRAWATYYRAPAGRVEYFLRLHLDSAGKTIGEAVTRDDIELDTDDVPDEFYT